MTTAVEKQPKYSTSGAGTAGTTVKFDHDMESEICHRFVQLSCEKMMASRGTGRLRRSLLILHLLRRARSDMHCVPYECASLVRRKSPAPAPVVVPTPVQTPKPSLPLQSSLWRWRDRRSWNDDATVAEPVSNSSCNNAGMKVVFDAEESKDEKDGLVPDAKVAVNVLAVVDNDDDEDERPPTLFCREEPKKAVRFQAPLPQQIQQQPMHDSDDDLTSNASADEEFTDEDDDGLGAEPLDGQARLFRRRVRKRKPYASSTRCVAEKRPKDADADSGVDVDLELNSTAGGVDEQRALSL